MKNKLAIECALAEEMQYKDKEPMELEDWTHNQGWIEALEWVLDISEERAKKEVKQQRLKEILLTSKERNEIIRQTTRRIQRENDTFVDDVDS